MWSMGGYVVGDSNRGKTVFRKDSGSDKAATKNFDLAQKKTVSH